MKLFEGPNHCLEDEDKKALLEYWYKEELNKSQDRLTEVVGMKKAMEDKITGDDLLNYLCFSEDEKQEALGMPYSPYSSREALFRGLEKGRWILPKTWSIQECYDWCLLESEFMYLIHRHKAIDLQRDLDLGITDEEERVLKQNKLYEEQLECACWSTLLY